MSERFHEPTAAMVTMHRRGRIGVFRVDNPPVNALSHGVRAGLLDALETALADDTIDAMVIACDGRTFIAGADIREFGSPMLPPLAGDVIERIARSNKPVVAALHGTALGGGFELAMACQFRVATPTTRVGLPEVKLGILPGSGGTQRLPRLIGVPAALRMIASGDPIDARRALKLGAIDAVIENDLIDGAVRFVARAIARGRQPKLRSDARVVCNDPDVFRTAEAEIRRDRPGVEAPLACVRAVRFACEMPLADGLRAEYALCMTLMHSSQSRALRHVFSAERQAMKIDGLPATPAKWPVRPIARVGIVGPGRTGAAIAAAIIESGVPVVLLGRNGASTARGVTRVRTHWRERIERGALSLGDVQSFAERLFPAHDDTALHDCDLVIESISDVLSLKQNVFRRLDVICKPGAILVSTTSHPDIACLSDVTGRATDIAGLHFVDPTNALRLVEIVRTAHTPADVVATLMQFVKRIGRVPIVSDTGNGLIANRMLAARSREIAFMMAEGAASQQIGNVLATFGFPTKPVVPITPQAPDDSGELCNRMTDDEILERCLLSIVNEGARLLDEGIAARPHDLDIAAVYGQGFPAHLGGPMFHADERGAASIVQALEHHARASGDARWQPSPCLVRLAEVSGSFYGDTAARRS